MLYYKSKNILYILNITITNIMLSCIRCIYNNMKEIWMKEMNL